MNTLRKSVFLFLPLLVLFVFYPFQITIAQQDPVSPTPTYDPFVEPLLPENPTELELGRNLYWHWCMTCHGDRGQGLTDEFRQIWEPEHQNCWGRGCHAGRPGDGGFPIPTIVPALVDETHLATFASVKELADFLKSTHPPQSPGILKDEEYHAIAVFAFTMNMRSLGDIPITEIPIATFVPTPKAIPPQESKSSSFPIYALITFATLLLCFFVLVRRTRLQG